MNVVDSNGRYQYVPGTKTLVNSDHPVWRARIAIAVGQGQWVCNPNIGHSLSRFARVKQSAAKVEEFEKALLGYLNPYGPTVAAILGARGVVSTTLDISDKALSNVPVL